MPIAHHLIFPPTLAEHHMHIARLYANLQHCTSALLFTVGIQYVYRYTLLGDVYVRTFVCHLTIACRLQFPFFMLLINAHMHSDMCGSCISASSSAIHVQRADARMDGQSVRAFGNLCHDSARIHTLYSW